MSSTNTYIAPPACENCGTEKTPTYICCKCIEKLNAKRTDYAALEAERDELKRRCEKMVGELHTAMIHSNPELVSKHMMAALAIAEGRDNG